MKRPIDSGMDPQVGPDATDVRLSGEVVADDRPCLSCGYNIRGLPALGHCPECGAPVSRSLQRRLLRYSGHEHVRTLHRGALLVEACLGAGVGATLLFIVFASVFGRWLGWNPPVVEFLSSIVWLLIGLLSALGWWWLSTPDPADEFARHDNRSRTLLRWSLIAYIAIATIAFAASLGGLGQRVSAPVAQGLGLVAAVIRIAQHLVSLYYLRSLALRLPSRRIAGAATSLTSFGFVLTVPAGILLVLTVGNMLGAKVGILNTLWCISLPLIICLLVWYLMYWSMIGRVRVELAVARRAAERLAGPSRGDPSPRVNPSLAARGERSV